MQDIMTKENLETVLGMLIFFPCIVEGWHFLLSNFRDLPSPTRFWRNLMWELNLIKKIVLILLFPIVIPIKLIRAKRLKKKLDEERAIEIKELEKLKELEIREKELIIYAKEHNIDLSSENEEDEYF